MPFMLLIVEDEPLVAKRLSRLSKDILGTKLSNQYQVADVVSARNILSQQPIDLVFLDLNLSDHDGFDLFKEFSAKAAHTIIVSAETDRALEAFEFGVLDFVPKPFTKERLSKAISRFWNPQPTPTSGASQIAFEVGAGVEVVSTKDILYFRGADKYSEATLKNGQVKFHTKPLNRLEDILSPHFTRSHKSYLVQNSAVKSLKSLEGSRYEIGLEGGGSLPIGRTRVDHVRQLLAIKETP